MPKMLEKPFQHICTRVKLGTVLLHAFDVVLAPSVEIDENTLASGVMEALACAFPVLEEPCYVFELSGVQKPSESPVPAAWTANRVSVEQLSEDIVRVHLPVVEQPLLEPTVRELFGQNCVPQNVRIEYRVLERGETVGIDALRREARSGVVGVGKLGELLEDRLS